MSVFVGIDGGGTRATAVAIDDDGADLARIESDAALVRATAPAAGADALAELTRRALEAVGVSPPADALCCALAGAGRDAEQTAIARALDAAGVARTVRVAADFEAAFEAAFGDGAGLLVVAGTGSVAYGRGPDGRTARAGGWGSKLGDEGSGYAIGLAGLRAVARAHDGRGPTTALAGRLTSAVGAATPQALIGWVDAAAKADVAALAPAVIDEAGRGDAVARALVGHAAADLVTHARAILHRLGPWPEPPAVALAGGLLLPGRPLRPYVVRALESTDPTLATDGASVDAARGAALLAARAYAGT